MGERRRVYKRSMVIDCQGQVSVNQKDWINIKVNDLSSGGMKFTADSDFENVESLHCKLTINHMLTSFSFTCLGKVASFQKFDNANVYGIMFLDLDENIKIRIDENISAITPVNRSGYV